MKHDTATLRHEHTQEDKVFKNFPEDPEFYHKDIRPNIVRIIHERGLEEWKYGILTNELHGHLGIYAIIGMKMGLFALEYLDAGAGQVQILSLAGSKPPVSCTNDGLQVSTGATIGHGLIKIMDADPPSPAAIFSYKEKSIRVLLKETFRQQVARQISAARQENGGLTDRYWKSIRELAIAYWTGWDRNKLFEVIPENIRN